MADAKISALTENTTPLPTDIVPIVDDPAGTPATQKVKVGNLLKGGYSITTTTTSGTPTPTGDYFRNVLNVTALTENATLGAPTGTPARGNMLQTIITASGATRTIGYNAAYVDGIATRETSLAAGVTLYQVFTYSGTSWVLSGQFKI